MAGNGPPPNPERSRARDNKPITSYTQSTKLFGKPLPNNILPADEDGIPQDWHPETLIWWEGMRRNPLMENAPDMDWNFLVETALLHNAMMHGDFKLAPELRLRATSFGVTPTERARMRIEIQKQAAAAKAQGKSSPKKPAAPVNVTSLEERRKRATS